jgi:ribose 5-phosphate isomerase B
MKLAIGADHAGFQLKLKIAQWLRSARGGKHQLIDVGTVSDASVDYPDFAKEVAFAVKRKRAAKGILVCGTGIGMCMTANKIRGIRAAVVWNPVVAALASEHNGANVVCIPGRFSTLRQAQAMIKAFLTTPFAGGRHLRRVNKIDRMR